MGSEVYEERPRVRNKSVDGSWVNHGSRISESYEDPMPEYISPKLVMLIAENAPSELDVFQRSVKQWGKVPAHMRGGNLNWQERKGCTKRAVEDKCKSECGVQVPTSSGRDRNSNQQFTVDARRSCPEAMTQREHDTDGSLSHRVENVKRKRPKSLDLSKPVSQETGYSVLADSPEDKRKHDHLAATADEPLSSSKSIDFIPTDANEKPQACRPASAPVVSASRYEIDALNAKPWRYGMKKKRISAELKPAEIVSKIAGLDPKKHSEVKKYMETKFAQLRKERQLEKARAEAVHAAIKEKQRKLDEECQALLKSQAGDVKTKQKTFSRPPWTSEYVTLAGTFRPWSRASGDLPPPKVPRNQEPVPLDLYTTVAAYEAARKSVSAEGCTQPGSSMLRAKRRSKKLKTKEGEKQLQGKNMTNMYDMAFPLTHPYHALRPHPEAGTRKKTPLLTKARWKSKGKSLKKFNPQKIYQLQQPVKYASKKCFDSIACRRSAKACRTPHSGGLCKETRATGMQKLMKSSSQNSYTTVLQKDVYYAISALKGRERDACTRSTVKRLKLAAAPAAEHISLQQFNCKPKYSRVKPAKCGHVTVDPKELSLQDLAKVMKSRFSPDSSREKIHRTRGSAPPGTDESRKCNRRASLSPRKLLRDEAVLQALRPTMQDSWSQGKHLRDAGIMEFFAPQIKDTTYVDTEISKDVSRAIRRQRMDMLRSLTEQLVKRVDAACAEQQLCTPKTVSEPTFESRVDTGIEPYKQQLQITPETVSEPTYESHVDTDNEPYNQQLQSSSKTASERTFESSVDIGNEPFNQLENAPKTLLRQVFEPHVDTGNVSINRPVGLNCLDESLRVEPKFYYHCPQSDILYHGHLSETEQAGCCETVQLPKKGRISVMIPGVDDLREDPLTVDTAELNVIPGTEVVSHSTVTDKGMSTSDNIPSGCCSYGPSSPSTDSSSPVILPTGTKYNLRRMKHAKNANEQARKRQKEAWTLPAEEDIHSVINLYTQRWLSREKKKSRAMCVFTNIGQGECEHNRSARSGSGAPSHEHAPEHNFKFGSAPMFSELETSESCIRSSELNSFTSRRCADSSWAKTQLLGRDHRESVSCFMQQNSGDHINTLRTQSPPEKSMATIADEPTLEHNSRNKTSAGDTSQRKPERMLVEFGDLRLCQSPTSFHLRLDTQRNDCQQKKADLEAATPAKMESPPADAYTALVGSSEDYQSQTLRAPITPIKITYARRLRTRTTADGAATDNEKIVIEFHKIPKEDDESARQNCSTGIGPSMSSASEAQAENPSVHVIDVKNLDHSEPNPDVQKDGDERKDRTGFRPFKVLQTGRHVSSSDVSGVVSQINATSGKGKVHRMVSRGTPARNGSKEADSPANFTFQVEQSERKLDISATNLPDSAGHLSDFLNTIHETDGKLERLPTKLSDFQGKLICQEMSTTSASDEAENSWERGEEQWREHDDCMNSTTKSNDGRLSGCGSKNSTHHVESILQEQRLEVLSGSKSEVQPELQQNSESTREWELKSRRNQLEAELQKLDAEIKKTRAKLQKNHSVFDAKIPVREQKVIAAEKLIPANTECSHSSTMGGVLSDELITGRLLRSNPSGDAPSDSPRKRTSGLSAETTGLVPLWTFDRKQGSPIYSNSFVSEDIRMEEEIFPEKTLEMVPDTEGNCYKASCSKLKFMDENLKYCEGKSKPVYPRVQPAKEVSEEELMTCTSIRAQDEILDEGSENSTGTLPYKRFDRASTREVRQARISPSSTKLKRTFLRPSNNEIAHSQYQAQQAVSADENKGVFLSTTAVKSNANPGTGEDPNSTLKEINLGALWSAPSGADSRSQNAHLKSDEELIEKSTRHLREDSRDAQQYAAGVHTSLQFWNSPILRGTTMTSVSTTSLDTRNSSGSVPGRNHRKVDTVEEVSTASSTRGEQPSYLNKRTPEFDGVLEDSPPSPKVGTDAQNKTSETAINSSINLNRLKGETAEVSKRVVVTPSSSGDRGEQKRKSCVYVSEANHQFQHTQQHSLEFNVREEDKSSSSRKESKNLVTDTDISAVFHYLPTNERTGEGTPRGFSEQLASRETSEVSTMTRDGLNDAAKVTVPLTLEENSTENSFPGTGLPSCDSRRMKSGWRLDPEEQLLQPEKIPFSTLAEEKSKLVTNLPHPDVSAEVSNGVVPRIRPGRQGQQKQSASEIIDSMCLQPCPICPFPTAEGRVTDRSSEHTLGSSNEESTYSLNPPCLGPTPPESYAQCMAKVRSQWRLYDPDSDVTSDQIRASTDLDQSADSSTVVEKQVVPSFDAQKLCAPLTKELHESCFANTEDDLQCDRQTSTGRGVVWLRHESDRTSHLEVPTFFMHKVTTSTVPEKFIQVSRNRSRASITDPNLTSAVTEVMNNFITTSGDAFQDSCQLTQIFQTSISLNPNPSMTKEAAEYQELAKFDGVVEGSWHQPFPPLLEKDPRPLEMAARMLTDSLPGEESPALAEIKNALQAERSKDSFPRDYSISSARIAEMRDMPSGSQGSALASNVDLSTSVPKQSLNLFSSLYDKQERGAFSTSEGSAVSEELENFVSEQDERLENNAMGASKHANVEQHLESRSSHPHLSDNWGDIGRTSCTLGEDSLRGAVSQLGTDLDSENHDVSVENQVEYVVTKESSDVELMTKSSSLFDNIEVRDSSAVPLAHHSGHFFAMSISEDVCADVAEPKDPTSPRTGVISAESKCKSCTDFDNVRHPRNDASTVLTTAETYVRIPDTNELTLSRSSGNGSEKSTSSNGCGQNGKITGDCANSMYSKDDMDIAADLSDHADEGNLDQYSQPESSRVLVDTMSISCVSSFRTVVKNNDNAEVVNKTVQDQAEVKCNSRTEQAAAENFQVYRTCSSVCDKEEKAATDVQVDRSCSSAYATAGSPCPGELAVLKPLPFLPIKPREHEESLTREVLNSKQNGYSARLGKRFGLNMPKNEVGHFDLESESPWTCVKESDESQNIPTQRSEERSPLMEVSRIDLRRVDEAQEEEQLSTPPASNDQLTNCMSGPPPWLPEDAYRLVECFLSSGSELLERASQISKAFSGSSNLLCGPEPGVSSSLDSTDHKKGSTSLQAPNDVEVSSSSGSSPSEVASSSTKTETAEDVQRHQAFTCETGECDEFLNPSRTDQFIVMRSFNPAHRHRKELTKDTKSAIPDTGNIIDPTPHDVNPWFRTLSGQDKTSAQQLTAQRPLSSSDSFTRDGSSLVPSSRATGDDAQHELQNDPSHCEKGNTSAETEISEFRELMNSVESSIPQLDSVLAVSLKISETGESSVEPDLHSSGNHCKDLLPEEAGTYERAFEDHSVEQLPSKVVEVDKAFVVHSDDSCVSGERNPQFINLATTREAKIQGDGVQILCKPSTQDIITTCHDQDSICSTGSDESQDLDGALDDINLQTPATRTGEDILHVLADVLTDKLIESMLEEALSGLACGSRSISRLAASSEDSQISTISKTPKRKIKGTTKGFMGVLKHFLPTGWRAASLKHKTGLFLQVEGLRPHPLSSASWKSSPVSGIEGLAGLLRNTQPSPDDFEERISVHRTTTETVIPILASRDYVQSFVQKTLELSRFLTDPSPSNWHDPKNPVGQDIYKKVVEAQHRSRFDALKLGDWHVQNKLLSDLINELLVNYSAAMHRTPSTIPLAVGGANVMHFVMSRIFGHETSASKHGPDIDKVVGKHLEDEEWEKCCEEARDLISDLAQGILCDLIDNFVQEMVHGRNNTSCSSTTVYRKTPLLVSAE